MNFPFEKAAAILDKLTENGFEAYVVGGAVRDYLLGRPVHDVDITTSAHPDEIMALFKRTIPIGIQHGTVAVIYNGRTYEVTTFRSESGYDDFRHPNQVSFESSLKKDLMRRDFTINALAMDRTGQVIDLFGGQDDMKKRRLRTVGCAAERIAEDPLRMMRGIRFVAELDFSLGGAERLAFSNNFALLKKISIERIDQEMNKLLAGSAATDAIRLLFDTGCIYVLPCLNHASADQRLFSVRFSVLTSDAERWAAFLETLGIRYMSGFAQAWRWPVSRRKDVGRLLQYDGNYAQFSWGRLSVYDAGPELAKAVERLETALGKAETDSLKQREHRIDDLWRSCPVKSRRELAATGHELIKWSGQKPGPWLSEAIAALEKKVVTGEVPNELGGIESWFRVWQGEQKKQY